MDDKNFEEILGKDLHQFLLSIILTGILIGYVAELSKYYDSELWKQDFAADEAGNLPSDLKRGVLSEDGIWNLLSDYREIKKKMQCT